MNSSVSNSAQGTKAGNGACTECGPRAPFGVPNSRIHSLHLPEILVDGVCQNIRSGKLPGAEKFIGQ